MNIRFLTAGGVALATIAAGCLGPVATASAADPVPSTTPAPTSRVAVEYPTPSQCSSGYLCTWVNYSGYWYLFKFYHCGSYRLSYWLDRTDDTSASYLLDDQTGSPTTILYGKTGNRLATYTPHHGHIYQVLGGKGGWNPVYSIKVC